MGLIGVYQILIAFIHPPSWVYHEADCGVVGHICDYYNGADIEIYSSDEVCLDDDYYEAKSEYYEDH